MNSKIPLGQRNHNYGQKDHKKWRGVLLTLTPPVVCSILLGYYNGPSLRDNAMSTFFAIDQYQVMDIPDSASAHGLAE